MQTVWMWCSGTSFSSGLFGLGWYGWVELGLNDLEGLFQPEQFYALLSPAPRNELVVR